MQSSGVRQTRLGLLGGRSPLLRLQSDEQLIALIRSGNDAAFELLLDRYRPRLLAFCRHMLGSKEDAEDVLQEVFASSYNAIRADERELNVRPWLYRIARNRCLNHLRRPTQDGRDTMDTHVHGHGITTADLVHRRADFRHLIDDIQKLPETQRTALLLREMDALSYEQIADAMENTVPSVKSLLVRARMSLAEAAEARQLSCGDVRLELAEVAEGLKKLTPPIRRHLRECRQCADYRTQLRKTTTAMAIALPFGPILVLKKLFLAKLGAAAAAGGGSAGGGAVGIGAVATKAITVTAATALLAGGAVEVHKIASPETAARKTAIVQQAPKREPAPLTGGQAAAALPPVAAVKAELKDEQAKTVEAKDGAAADTATGTTGATSVSDEPQAPAGATGPTAPVSGSPSTGQGDADPSAEETGGASLPPESGPAPGAGTGTADGSSQGSLQAEPAHPEPQPTAVP
jgi:RNA polymerase sigma factor (sigma-70 family)